MATTSGTPLIELTSRLRLAVVPLARQVRQQTIGSFSPTQLSILGAVKRYGPIALGALAEREHLSPASISKAMTVLEGAGVIERIPDAVDRRVCYVHLSAEGAKWIEANQLLRDEWLAERLLSLSDEERQALERALPTLERLIADDT